MIETLFITKVFHLRVKERLAEPIELMPGLFLTNNRETVGSLLSPSLKNAIGVLETETLIDADAVIYGIYPAEFMQDMPPTKFLFCNLLWTTSLLQTTWLIKDNCFGLELGFVEHPFKGKTSQISSNFLKAQPTLADCSVQAVEFTAEEFRFVAQLHADIYSHEDRINATGQRHFDKSFSRVGRVLSFLANARSAFTPADKIASYCTCFEALFSTETTELSHKLAERIAHFLEESPESKVASYKKIKNAYGVRSKVVHGDSLSLSQQNSLPTIVQDCDSYLRRSLNGILCSPQLIAVFNQKSDKLEDFFTNLIFGQVALIAEQNGCYKWRAMTQKAAL